MFELFLLPSQVSHTQQVCGDNDFWNFSGRVRRSKGTCSRLRFFFTLLRVQYSGPCTVYVEVCCPVHLQLWSAIWRAKDVPNPSSARPTKYRFDNSVPNRLLEQTRISILGWNPGPRRGTPGAIEEHSQVNGTLLHYRKRSSTFNTSA